MNPGDVRQLHFVPQTDFTVKFKYGDVLRWAIRGPFDHSSHVIWQQSWFWSSYLWICSSLKDTHQGQESNFARALKAFHWDGKSVMGWYDPSSHCRLWLLAVDGRRTCDIIITQRLTYRWRRAQCWLPFITATTSAAFPQLQVWVCPGAIFISANRFRLFYFYYIKLYKVVLKPTLGKLVLYAFLMFATFQTTLQYTKKM